MLSRGLCIEGWIFITRLCERSAAIHTRVPRVDCRVAALLAKTIQRHVIPPYPAVNSTHVAAWSLAFSRAR